MGAGADGAGRDGMRAQGERLLLLLLLLLLLPLPRSFPSLLAELAERPLGPRVQGAGRGLRRLGWRRGVGAGGHHSRRVGLCVASCVLGGLRVAGRTQADRCGDRDLVGHARIAAGTHHVLQRICEPERLEGHRDRGRRTNLQGLEVGTVSRDPDGRHELCASPRDVGRPGHGRLGSVSFLEPPRRSGLERSKRKGRRRIPRHVEEHLFDGLVALRFAGAPGCEVEGQGSHSTCAPFPVPMADGPFGTGQAGRDRAASARGDDEVQTSGLHVKLRWSVRCREAPSHALARRCPHCLRSTCRLTLRAEATAR